MRPAYQEEEMVDVLEAVETTDLMDLVVFNRLAGLSVIFFLVVYL